MAKLKKRHQKWRAAPESNYKLTTTLSSRLINSAGHCCPETDGSRLQKPSPIVLRYEWEARKAIDAYEKPLMAAPKIILKAKPGEACRK